jgi:hypothetical protein
LAACATVDADNLSTTYLDQFAAPNPTLAEFPVCHGFGCSLISRGSLTNAEWRRVAAVFRPPPKDAEAERHRIARAVALMQVMVGPKTGTAAHQWTHKDMMVLQSHGDRSQLDCIDEAVNTWTYMTMMERDGLFRFHRVAKLSHAGGVTDLANIRNTAVLQEKGGEYFAIDPSLVDHGVIPPVMQLSVWLGSWPPNITLSNERVDTTVAVPRAGSHDVQAANAKPK